MAIFIIVTTLLLLLAANAIMLRTIINNRKEDEKEIENEIIFDYEKEQECGASLLDKIYEDINKTKELNIEECKDITILEEYMLNLIEDKAVLSVIWEKYEDELELTSADMRIYMTIKADFYCYKIESKRVDANIDLLLNKISDRIKDIEDMRCTKHAGFHN